MGPISAIDTGQVSRASGLQPGMSSLSPTSSGTAAAGTGLSSSSALGTSQAVQNLQSAVTQLLQSAGGSVENDRLLRLLIVALILLSLLEQMQDQGGADKQPLAQLGNGSGDRSQYYVGIYTSSTTISIQQSTTTIVTGSGFDPGGGGAEASQSAGGRMDVSA